MGSNFGFGIPDADIELATRARTGRSATHEVNAWNFLSNIRSSGICAKGAIAHERS